MRIAQLVVEKSLFSVVHGLTRYKQHYCVTTPHQNKFTAIRVRIENLSYGSPSSSYLWRFFILLVYTRTCRVWSLSRLRGIQVVVRPEQLLGGRYLVVEQLAVSRGLPIGAGMWGDK